MDRLNRIRISQAVLSCIVLWGLSSCSSTLLQGESSKIKSEDNQSTDKGDTDKNDGEGKEEASVDPSPIAGINLVSNCDAAVISNDNADISCRAYDGSRPKEKLPAVTWNYELSVPLTPTQSVTMEATPNQSDRDAVYHLKAASGSELDTLIKNFKPYFVFQSTKRPLTVPQAAVQIIKGCEQPNLSPDAPCTATRIRYQSAAVNEPQLCVSETQQATCVGGSCGAFSGTMTNVSCVISRTRYPVTLAASCTPEAQTSTCTEGSCTAFSGKYSETTCGLCAGAAVGGFCWYNSGQNTDCISTCNTHGGVTAGTITYAGYPDGTLAQCSAVLDALNMGTTGTMATDNNSAGYTAGCGLYTGNSRLRYISGKTTQTNSSLMFLTARVCSCVN